MYNLKKIDTLAKDLDSFHRDCAITVALKIADDSCKMDEYERSIFMKLYNALDSDDTEFFEKTVFSVISQAQKSPSAQIYSQIKTLREAAMEMITRPKMKAFKAFVRQQISE